MANLPTTDEIAEQLSRMVPPGALAQRIGNNLRRLWQGFGDEFARVYGRVADSINEAHPSTTTELIDEWEQEYGLPDPCITIEQTLEARRAAVGARLTGVGGQSRGYFIALAASMGITITIGEERPFLIGQSGMGDGVGDASTAYLWTVYAPASTSLELREVLECTFQRLKPAHTQVQFNYGLVVASGTGVAVNATAPEGSAEEISTGAPVDYVAGSEQRFSWLAQDPFSVGLGNADIAPEDFADAVLVITLASKTSNTTFNPPTSITVGAITVPFVSITGTPGFGTGRQHLVVGMVRIPAGGFPDPTLNITWPQIGASELEAFGSAQVFYNVDPISDGFALGSSALDAVPSLGSLSIPAGGAVFGASIQYTNGSGYPALIGSFIYIMLDPPVSIGNGHEWLSGYSVFSSGSTELISANVGNLRPGIAFVMAGTGS